MKQLRMLMLVLAFCMGATIIPNSSAEAATLLRAGSQNGDVWDLQYRLQLLGFYSGSLDGIFGSQTRKAVKAFQTAYGLPPDGIMGSRSWTALKKVSVNAHELTMLAKLIYGEARGESYEGQVAVGAVVMNRLQSPKFPKTIPGIIFEPLAFTAIDDGQYYLTPDATAYKAAWDAARGWDPSGGALYYFNPRTATSPWIWSRPQIKTIDNHIFAK